MRSELDNPRADKNRMHEVIEVILLCVFAVISGAEERSDIEGFETGCGGFFIGMAHTS